MLLLQVAQVVPVGPGPSFWGLGGTPPVAGFVMTMVRGAAAGATKPGGAGGLSPKYDGGGAGLGCDCSYGGGRPILFSTEIDKMKPYRLHNLGVD